MKIEPFSEESCLKHIDPLGKAIQEASAADLLLPMIAINKEEKEENNYEKNNPNKK